MALGVCQALHVVDADVDNIGLSMWCKTCLAEGTYLIEGFSVCAAHEVILEAQGSLLVLKRARRGSSSMVLLRNEA